jgi:two-component system response regulator GlrR
MKSCERPYILYVEDNEDSCQMMSITLDASGIDVACAHGVKKAIEFPDKNKFDLFLIDLWLNDGSGSDLCKKLRTEFPDIPVVFYTGGATQQERKEGTLAGAAAYLVKPYSELVAPTVFRLVAGTDSSDMFDPLVDLLRRSGDKARRPINITAGSFRAIPLMP